MPILGVLVAAIVGAAVWYWRLKMVREAGSEIIDSVERMRGAFKRRQFRKRAEAAPLASIKDPAIAAVAFFSCLANEKPMFVDAARNVIRSRMSGIIAAKDMDEVIIFGDWAAKGVINIEDPIRRFRDLWFNALTTDERSELIGIAEQVSAVGGEPTAEPSKTLQTLRRSLLN